jgi:hypothetical protein
MSDKLVTEIDTYSTHKRLSSMPSIGFEPVLPAVKWPQAYALNHMSIWISMLQLICEKISHGEFLAAVFHVISDTKFPTHSLFIPGNMASVKEQWVSGEHRKLPSNSFYFLL